MGQQKVPSSGKKITSVSLKAMKAQSRRISMVTGYDATFARLIDEAGIDAVLVGDSLGMVVQGADNTLGVTLDEMIYHTRAVRRGIRRAHLIADLPFMSYQTSPEAALQSAGRLLKEAGAEAVKLEGGSVYAETVRRLVGAGIPVMGHVGLTPQSVHTMGGFKIQGQGSSSAQQILADARALEAAGAYAVVLEGVPVELSRVITESLSIPTIGIGAGVDCDGQVLVIYDLLGLCPDFGAHFVKRYDSLASRVTAALEQYRTEVQRGLFPEEVHTFHAKEQLLGPRRLEADAAGADAVQDTVPELYGVPT